MIGIGIIPARYGSSRFPGKPLAPINGKPMIQWVYQQAVKSDLSAVVVATDDQRIMEVVHAFGGKAVMTPSDIPSGTDRCRVALEELEEKPDFIVNIQGDEPFIAPDQINKVLDLLAKKDAEIATLICAAVNREEVENPNRVKVVTALDGKALYFSRYGIPYPRNERNPDPGGYYIHLGLYGFTFDALIETGRQRVSFLEEKEGLEQLRWLENGMSIYTGITEMRTESVDTPEDLAAIEKKYFL